MRRRRPRRSARCSRWRSAFTNAGSVIQTRRLTDTETTSSIVFYFSLFCTIGGLLTLPFGWIVPTWPQLAALIGLGMIGGLSHILLTESYRYAPASLVAPLDYTAMLWAFILGYWFFGELPTATVYRRRGDRRGIGTVRDLARAPARARTRAGARGVRPADRDVGIGAWLPERLERDDRAGVLDARDDLHLLVHEMADIGRSPRHRTCTAGRSRPPWNRSPRRSRRRRCAFATS